MNDTCYIEALFPTLICYKDFGKPDKKIINYVKDIALKHKDNPFDVPCYSTVQTYNEIIKDAQLEQIKKNILHVIGAFCAARKLETKDLELFESWANLYEKDGYQDLHHHHGSLISGVYYLKSEGKKDLVFQDPSHFFIPDIPRFSELNINNASKVKYNTYEGRCIVFMSSLMHRTIPATQERLSISFNVRYKK